MCQESSTTAIKVGSLASQELFYTEWVEGFRGWGLGLRVLL